MIGRGTAGTSSGGRGLRPPPPRIRPWTEADRPYLEHALAGLQPGPVRVGGVTLVGALTVGDTALAPTEAVVARARVVVRGRGVLLVFTPPPG